VSRPCSVCLHPRRQQVEDLLSRGWSIRCAASAIGVGAAALHRHWTRHTDKRDMMTAADSLSLENETVEAGRPARPETMPHAVLSTDPWMLRRPWGGQPFCWCASCQGRRGHYMDPTHR
jgi:hypothetical protein